MVQNESNMVQASQPVVQPAVLKLCVPVKVRVKNPQGGFKSEDGVAFFTRSCLLPPHSIVVASSSSDHDHHPTAVPPQPPILSRFDALSIAEAGFLFALEQQPKRFRNIRAKDNLLQRTSRGLLCCMCCFLKTVGCSKCDQTRSDESYCSTSLFQGCLPPMYSCTTNTCNQVR